MVKLINSPTKKWWPRAFQETASYCIPSFTLELKIQTYLFFPAETWFFDFPPPAFNKRFFFRYMLQVLVIFLLPKTPTVLCLFVGSTHPRHPVYQFRSGFLSSWVVPNGTYLTRKDMLFGLWFRSP